MGKSNPKPAAAKPQSIPETPRSAGRRTLWRLSAQIRAASTQAAQAAALASEAAELAAAQAVELQQARAALRAARPTRLHFAIPDGEDRLGLLLKGDSVLVTDEELRTLRETYGTGLIYLPFQVSE